MFSLFSCVPLYTVKLNKFADLTFEEFSQLWLMDPQDCSATNTAQKVGVVTDPPASVDWRDKGAVTPVKNQVCFDPLIE